MPLMIAMFEVARIQDIENEFPVKIDIDRKSKKIQIEGHSDNITLAVDAVHSIFHELEKEERTKLEAEFISKEVITDFMVLVVNGKLILIGYLPGLISVNNFCSVICVANNKNVAVFTPPRGRGIVFDRFLCLFLSFLLYLFLCQQHYEKTAGPICMKFSGKVWSDHGTT